MGLLGLWVVIVTGWSLLSRTGLGCSVFAGVGSQRTWRCLLEAQLTLEGYRVGCFDHSRVSRWTSWPGQWACGAPKVSLVSVSPVISMVLCLGWGQVEGEIQGSV